MVRWAGRPLLGGGPARRRAAITVAGCAVVVAVLGAAFAHQGTADAFDRAVDEPVVSWLGPHRTLLDWMQYPGTQVPALVISVAMAVGCLASRRYTGAILALAAVLVATRVDDWLLKPLFHRTYLGALAYPSGHTTSVVAMVTVYAILFLLPARRSARARAPRLAGLATLLALTVITVLGVIGLRWHYLTDTVGGACVGVGAVCALALALDWAAARLSRERQAG
jgi:membrane-associated phospholipid phosphatase